MSARSEKALNLQADEEAAQVAEAEVEAARKLRIRSSALHRDLVKRWNRYHPVGTPVIYWPVLGRPDQIRSRTRSPAQVLSGHTAVVWLEGHAACVSLLHCKPEEA